MTDDQRLGPPQVEPLSDAAWSRVERGIWSQIDSERPAGAPQGENPPPGRRDQSGASGRPNGPQGQAQRSPSSGPCRWGTSTSGSSRRSAAR